MPILGSGLSLGTISRISNYDLDASSYIIANSIPNSAVIRTTNNNYTKFDGNGYLSHVYNTANDASNYQLTAGTIKTFSFWFKPTAFNLQYIFAKELEYAIRIFSQNSIDFLWGNISGSSWLGGYSFNLPSALQANSWYHAIAVFDRINNKFKFYLNESQIVNDNLTYASFTPNNNDFCIGGKNPIQTGTNYTGGIKQFYVINRDVTSTEISALYNSGVTPLYYSVYSSTSGSFIPSLHFPLNGSVVDTSVFINYANSATIDSSESTFVSINPQSQLNDFVVGIKSLGLWSNMVCWPSRSFQNKTSITTLGSLGGLASWPLSVVNNGYTPVISEDGFYVGTGACGYAYYNASSVTYTNCSLISVFNSSFGTNTFAGYPCYINAGTATYTNANYYYITNPGNSGQSTGATINPSGSTSNSTSTILATMDTKFYASTLSPTALTYFYNLQTNSVANSTPAVVDRIGINGRFNPSGGPFQTGYAGNQDYQVAHAGASYAFNAFFNSTINVNSVYSLYKTTLGYGFYLP